MRIIHLSDIHLSKENYSEFENNYKQALINDLDMYNTSIPIDLIVITGDLVDCGGHSLLELQKFKTESFNSEPYKIFEEVFINPISIATGIPKYKFIFIPGNHDVDEHNILLIDESKMQHDISTGNIERYLFENNSFTHSERIRKFKEFEKEFHKNTPLYSYTNNESTFVYQDKDGNKIGFILVNDSWRCKSIKLLNEDQNHYFGVQQIYNGLKRLENTDLNICLMHHSLNNYKEKDEVERCIQCNKIELLLYGHYHNVRFEKYLNTIGDCCGIRGRAALFKPNEKIEEYQSGYQIIDIDIISYKIQKVHYRKYIYKGCRFDSDTNAAPNGVDDGINGKGIELYRKDRRPKTYNLDISQFKQKQNNE